MDNSSTTDAATAGLIGGVVIVYFVVLIVMIAAFIWIYWRIFQKAGFNGALSLLNLVPGIGQLICILILAFGRWPIEDQLALAMGGNRLAQPPPPAPMPPPAQPGSSIVP
jgi:uncharacterized membrane protein YhaH (DUF805 family)